MGLVQLSSVKKLAQIKEQVFENQLNLFTSAIENTDHNFTEAELFAHEEDLAQVQTLRGLNDVNNIRKKLIDYLALLDEHERKLAKLKVQIAYQEGKFNAANVKQQLNGDKKEFSLAEKLVPTTLSLIDLYYELALKYDAETDKKKQNIYLTKSLYFVSQALVYSEQVSGDDACALEQREKNIKKMIEITKRKASIAESSEKSRLFLGISNLYSKLYKIFRKKPQAEKTGCQAKADYIDARSYDLSARLNIDIARCLENNSGVYQIVKDLRPKGFRIFRLFHRSGQTRKQLLKYYDDLVSIAKHVGADESASSDFLTQYALYLEKEFKEIYLKKPKLLWQHYKDLNSPGSIKMMNLLSASQDIDVAKRLGILPESLKNDENLQQRFSYTTNLLFNLNDTYIKTLWAFLLGRKLAATEPKYLCPHQVCNPDFSLNPAVLKTIKPKSAQKNRAWLEKLFKKYPTEDTMIRINESEIFGYSKIQMKV